MFLHGARPGEGKTGAGLLLFTSENIRKYEPLPAVPGKHFSLKIGRLAPDPLVHPFQFFQGAGVTPGQRERVAIDAGQDGPLFQGVV